MTKPTTTRAIINTATTALHHTGRGVQLPAGSYPVVDIDGAADRGVLYVTGPDGNLIGLNPTDPAVTVVTPGEPFQHPDLPPEMLTGFVVGDCGHRVAGSEWRAGFRTCERCPS